MALNPNRQLIEIAYSETLAEVPTGLEKGELGVNLADTPPRLYVGASAGPLLLTALAVGGTRTISWVAGANPAGGTILFADRNITIKSITGVVEIINNMAANVSVVKAAQGTALTAATAIHGGTFDANASAGVYQTLTLTTTPTVLAAGERLGLRTTGTFFDSAASITVEYE